MVNSEKRGFSECGAENLMFRFSAIFFNSTQKGRGKMETLMWALRIVVLIGILLGATIAGYLAVFAYYFVSFALADLFSLLKGKQGSPDE